MTAGPVVSVVIAAFNAERFIAQTCRSALAQTIQSIEVIVVDDGSTDGTAWVVNALSKEDSRIRLIQQQNAGVAAARNTGIAAATGKYVAPLDADDVWAAAKLERQVRRLEEAGNKAGMAYCWWSWIDESGKVLDRSPRWRVEGAVLDRLIEINFTGSASVPLFRRACVEEAGGYNVELRGNGAQGCEDWDLALRVAGRHAVVVVPEVLVAYRRHTTSMSAACETMWRSQAQVLRDLETRTPGLSRAALRRSKGQFSLYLAGVAFWSGQYIEAARWASRVRPLTMLLRVMPHVSTILMRRLLAQVKPPAGPRFGADMFDEAKLPEPLIPYDQIYSQHWRKEPKR